MHLDGSPRSSLRVLPHASEDIPGPLSLQIPPLKICGENYQLPDIHAQSRNSSSYSYVTPPIIHILVRLLPYGHKLNRKSPLLVRPTEPFTTLR